MTREPRLSVHDDEAPVPVTAPGARELPGHIRAALDRAEESDETGGETGSETGGL